MLRVLWLLHGYAEGIPIVDHAVVVDHVDATVVKQMVQGSVDEVVAGLEAALQSDWESLGTSLPPLPTRAMLRALVLSQQGVQQHTMELLDAHLALLGQC